MYKSFKIIDDFIRETYGFDFLRDTIDPRIVSNGLKPIQNTHEAVMSIVRDNRPPFAEEFVKHVYPLLEVAVHWQQLKEERKLTGEFLDECKKRILNANPGNFFGTIFEVDMACRCLLSNWGIRFVEDCRKTQQHQVDFVFSRDGKALAVECRSLRFTGFFSAADLTIEKIDNAVEHHAQKFEPQHLAQLGVPVDQRILIIDITAQDYVAPQVVGDLEKVTIPSVLDSVVFTWREDITDGWSHILRVKYNTIGSLDYGYFSVTYEARFHRRGWFYMRKYVFPEPIVSSPSGLIRGATDEDFFR